MRLYLGCIVPLITVIFALSGCSLLGSENANQLLNPQSLHDVQGTEQAAVAAKLPIADYYAAMELAKSSYTSSNVTHQLGNVENYVEEGIGLVDTYCLRWFRLVSNTQRIAAYSRSNTNVISQLGTTVLGIADASADLVTGYGAVNTAISGFSSNFETAFLGAPTTSKVKGKILLLMSQEAKRLRQRSAAGSPKLKFKEAYGELERYADLCTFEAAREIVDGALNVSEPIVNPASGEITTSSFTKDDSGDRIRAFWKPDGTNANPNNTKIIKNWLGNNGIDSTSITYFMRSNLFVKARVKMVLELNIPPL